MRPEDITIKNTPENWTVTVVGIGDKKGVGKNTFARLLADRLPQIDRHAIVVELAFANGVKDSVASKFGVERGLLDNEEFKRQVHPKLGITWRRVLQLEGTEYGRNAYHEDIWVDRVESDAVGFMRQCDPEQRFNFYFLVTDCRFANEADWVSSRTGGKVIKISRPQLERDTDSHESERGLPFYDILVSNDSTIDALRREAGVVAAILFRPEL